MSRNFGQPACYMAGLEQSKGDAVIYLHSDLQDPPEVIPELIDKWKEGNQIVWAVRNHRMAETTVNKGTSRLYYWLMRKVVGINDLHSSGADFFLIDKKVIEAFKLFKESK